MEYYQNNKSFNNMSNNFFLFSILILWKINLIKCEILVKTINTSTRLENNDNNNFNFLAYKDLKQDKIKITENDNNNIKVLPKRYDGAQLWRIPVFKGTDRLKIQELWEKYDGQTWRDADNNFDILLQEEWLKPAEELLYAHNLSHILLIKDLQKIIETENLLATDIDELENRKGHRMTWKAYHRVSDIYGYLNHLAVTYPDLCAVENIGFSTENRPLLVLKISNNKPNNKPIWIDGGIHAREWISPASVTYLIEKLTQNWDTLPNFMQQIDWYILPVVNPDGYEYTHETDRLWRKNRRKARGSGCSGVDLNRNFGFQWGGKGTSANSCSDIYRGLKAFSEPESSAIATFMSKFGEEFFKAYVTIHSYGQYILYPWGYDAKLTFDNIELNRIGKEAANNVLRTTGARYTVGSSATTLYPAAGGSDDWAKGVLKIKYSFTLELRDTGIYGFILPARFIESNGLETMIFIETLAKAISKNK